MKAVICGTAQAGHLGDEAVILRKAGLTVLQRMAGYIPPTITAEIPYYQPVGKEYAACADAMMTRLCHQEVTGVNPRAPYLMIIWLLLGANNPFCLRRYAQDEHLIRQLARLLLRIACGDEPSTAERQAATRAASIMKVSTLELYNRGWRTPQVDAGLAHAKTRMDAVATAILRSAGAVNAKMLHRAWVAWSVGAIVSELVRFEGSRVEATVWKQARLWCYISDEEAGHIARKLLFEMLDG